MQFFRFPFLGMALALLAGSWAFNDRALAADSYELGSPHRPGELNRVQVSIQIGGELTLKSDGKTRTIPMSVTAKLDYEEGIAQVTNEAAEISAYRYYDEAAAQIKLDNGGETPSLRENQRLIAVHVGETATTLSSPQGPLKREEVDLIDVPANSLLLQSLLSPNAVSVGDHWKHNEQAIARLLGMDATSLVECESTLVDVTDGVAKIRLSGIVQGAVGGAATEVELRAKYEVDINAKRVTWLAILIKEKRSIGHVSAGSDVVSKVILQVSPLEQSEHLDLVELGARSALTSPQATQLFFKPRAGGFELNYDRRWFVTSDEREVAILRLVDRGELLAQCNISPVSQATKEDVDLEQYQREVQTALGSKFGQFVQATESVNGDNNRVFRMVVVHGEQSDLPIRWIYYQITGREGNRVSLAFTLEQNLEERFGAADEALVANLRLVDPRSALLQPHPRAVK